MDFTGGVNGNTGISGGRGSQRTIDSNPSATSLRTADTFPYTGEAFSARQGRGTKEHGAEQVLFLKSSSVAAPAGHVAWMLTAAVFTAHRGGRNSLPPSIPITHRNQKRSTVFRQFFLFGGDEEDRTLDLTDANRTLSQLSYAPTYDIPIIIADSPEL